MNDETDDAAENRKNGRNTDGTFAVGNAGGKKGARHKTTLLAEKLMSDDVEGVVKSVVDAAKSGDMQACRLILERIVPPRKDATISIDLPEINTIEDAAVAMGIVVKAAANAEIGLGEADALTKLIQGASQALELTELARRIEALEQKANI